MKQSKWLGHGALACLVAASLCVAAPRIQAQPAQQSVTERLIELLVQKGVLPRAQAKALLKQAEAEARVQRQHPRRAAAARKPKAPAAARAAARTVEPKLPPGTVRVTYVPKIVRDQIAAQVRQQVMHQAKTEGWAAPNKIPDWLDRITIYGDIRVRGQGDFLPQDNSPYFVNFGAINGGSPYDITGAAGGPPLLNTTENRWRTRLRARVGLRAEIEDWLTADIRLATGNDAAPISTNQTLGQDGPFAKYAVWLDRAYVKAMPIEQLALLAGRMPNPFWTSDLVYYDDLSFDGFAVAARQNLNDSLAVFGSAGAFPTFNTAFNFGTTTAYPSRNAWLFGVQGGTEWRITPDYVAKLAVGYFNYSNIQGKISAGCEILFASDTCNTDASRMLFPSFGNTMMVIRNLVANPNNPNGPQPQYFGLASPFHVLDIHGRMDFDTFRPIHIALEADFADNLAFDARRVTTQGVSNYGAGGRVQAGNIAWMVRGIVGTQQILKRWDWNAWLAYKYLESDSVLAALTDSDFHLGGTNAKGFILAGNLGVARNTWITARWLSSNQISGPNYAVDTVQLDLNVRF